jgi:hypothetical protein
MFQSSESSFSLLTACNEFNLFRLEESTGFGDKGREGIVKWFDAHKCNSLCKKLELKSARLDMLFNTSMQSAGGSTTGPLRIGWPSATPSRHSKH